MCEEYLCCKVRDLRISGPHELGISWVDFYYPEAPMATIRPGAQVPIMFNLLPLKVIN